MGCISYLGMVSGTDCNVALVMARCTVVPKHNNRSMPKLELLAVVKGAKLHRHIKDSINLPLQSCCLCFDLTTILTWLHNSERRLQKFVSRKIALNTKLKLLLKATPMSKPAPQDLSNVDENTISKCMLCKGIDVICKFDPVKNPHVGGEWERAIKTVKYKVFIKS